MKLFKIYKKLIGLFLSLALALSIFPTEFVAADEIFEDMPATAETIPPIDHPLEESFPESHLPIDVFPDENINEINVPSYTLPQSIIPATSLVPQTIALREGVDGYTGTKNVGFIINNNLQMMGASQTNSIMLGLPDGRSLIYFDLKDIFPPGVDLSYIFVTDVTLSLFQSFNVNVPRDVQLRRVLDPDNLGMWVEGTNNSTAWDVSSRNNGASWFNRDNGFDQPGQEEPPDRTPIPWTAGGGNLDSAVASTPSSTISIGNHTPFTNNRADFTGSQMRQDVNAWIQDPASNQGWMISRAIVPDIPDTAGPHFWNRFAPNIAHRPMLTITFVDLSDLGNDAVIFQNDVEADQDGFFLQWFPFGDIDHFLIEYEIEGIPHFYSTTETSVWIRNSGFIYDEDFTFTIVGYLNNIRVALSDPKSAQIVDNRTFTPSGTGFDLSWSSVYGAVEYRIEIVRESDGMSDLVVTTNNTATVNNSSFFTFGFFSYRLTAHDALDNVIRDSGIQPFMRPDVTPPSTTVRVEANATWARTATDAMLLPANRGAVTITVESATDLESGVARTEYRFNNDHRYNFQQNNPGVAANSWNTDWVMDPWHPTSAGSTITITAQGVTRVWVRSVDNAGNVERPQPIYIVIDNSPLFVSPPVVRSGDTVLDRLQPGSNITVSMELENRDPAGSEFTAYLMAVLYDASGRMRDITVSPSVHFGIGTASTLNTAIMTLPSRTDGWYLDIFLMDASNDNPIYYPHRFPHALNTHRHRLNLRPMINSPTSFTVSFDANSPDGINPSAIIVAAGQVLALPAVSRANYIFNGWFTAATGGTWIGGAGDSFIPGAHTALFAQWVPIAFPGLYQVSFHIYTGNQGLIDRFGYYGTLNKEGILVINVPVIPGKPHSEWPSQNLLNVILNIGLVHSVDDMLGHAFWGWFRDETLNSSGRRGPTANAEIPNPTNPGLRRPLLTDRCEWINDGMDGGPQDRILDLLQNPYITQAQIYSLFGNTSTLDLFAIWSLWGDVNDDDVVNFTDLGVLQAYLLFRYVAPDVISLNRRAGDVFNNASLDWTDFNLLQSYLLTRDANPGQVILGVLPHELRSLVFANR